MLSSPLSTPPGWRLDPHLATGVETPFTPPRYRACVDGLANDARDDVRLRQHQEVGSAFDLGDRGAGAVVGKRWSSVRPGTAVPNTAQDGFVRQAAAVGIVERRGRDRREIAMNAGRRRERRRETSWNRAGSIDTARCRRATAPGARAGPSRATGSVLQVVDRFALVGRDAGDVHQPGDFVRAAGDRDPRRRRNGRPGPLARRVGR